MKYLHTYFFLDYVFLFLFVVDVVVVVSFFFVGANVCGGTEKNTYINLSKQVLAKVLGVFTENWNIEREVFGEGSVGRGL